MDSSSVAMYGWGVARSIASAQTRDYLSQQGVRSGCVGPGTGCAPGMPGQQEHEAPRLVDGTMDREHSSDGGLAGLPAAQQEHAWRGRAQDVGLPRIGADARLLRQDDGVEAARQIQGQISRDGH
jgi:hypothetical protein